MTALLSVRGVKTFYGRVMALKGVDLDINEGEIVTLIGANGAGKSTLMMTVCGNPRAREGRITFAGRDITQMPTHEIARFKLAQAPEGRRIFSRMTVLENLQMGATTADPSTFAQDLERVLTLFPRLKQRIGQRGGTLSGGEQQMLAIARALMARPRLLLLDEPSLGLAPLIVRQIFDAIRTLNKQDGLTVFLVEQNAFHALKLAHRGYVMVNGLITLSGSGRELLARPEVKSAYLEGGRQQAAPSRRPGGRPGRWLLMRWFSAPPCASSISACSAARFCRPTITWSTARFAWRSASPGSASPVSRRWSRNIAGSTNPTARCAGAASRSDVIFREVIAAGFTP